MSLGCRIAELAGVDVGVVQKAVEMLVNRGWADLLDIFQFRNVYRLTEEVFDFARDRQALLACSEYAGSSTTDGTDSDASKV